MIIYKFVAMFSP